MQHDDSAGPLQSQDKRFAQQPSSSGSGSVQPPYPQMCGDGHGYQRPDNALGQVTFSKQHCDSQQVPSQTHNNTSSGNVDHTSTFYDNRAYMSLLPFSEDAKIVSQLPSDIFTGSPQEPDEGDTSAADPTTTFSLPTSEVPEGIVDVPIWKNYFQMIERDVVSEGTFQVLTDEKLQKLLDQSVTYHNGKHRGGALPRIILTKDIRNWSILRGKCNIFWAHYFSLVHREIMSPDTFEKLLDEDLQSLLDEATTLFNRKYVENVDGAFPLPRTILTDAIQEQSTRAASSARSGDVQKGMRIVLQPSKGNSHVQKSSYNLIQNEDGSPLTPTQRLLNVLRCEDLLHLETMSFANLVRHGMIVENLGNPVFWDFTNALLYGSAHASNQLVQVPVARVLDQNEVTLAQLTYCLGIAFNCIEQFQFGNRMRLDFSKKNCGPFLATVWRDIQPLEKDKKLSARRSMAHRVGMRQHKPLAMT